MRPKMYKKEQLVQGAYEYVRKNGFNKFTARNVADSMGMSTQPIYAHFSNMQNLKDTLIETIMIEMQRDVFPVAKTGEKLLDGFLNYVEFAQKNPKLFAAIFVESETSNPVIYQYSYRYFTDITKDTIYENLSEEEHRCLHDALLISSTGMATLTAAKILSLNHEQIIAEINETILHHVPDRMYDEVKKVLNM